MRSRNREVVLLAVLVTFCLFLFFFQLGSRPLWDVDEGMHAATSRDMVVSGDWVVPTFNGKPFYDKPVLFNWLVAVSFLVFGFTEFAARLPAALLGLACVLLTYGLARRMAGPVVGFLSGVILATSIEFLMLSRTVMHDMALAVSVAAALGAFWAGFTDEKHRRRWMLLSYVAMGVGVMAKGPLGVLLPAMVVGLFLLIERRLGFLKQMAIGWGILIVAVVGSPWYVLVALRDLDYARYFLLEQNLGRFISTGSDHHVEPVYYYLIIIVAGLHPWGIFLPAAVWRAFRNRRGPENAATRFLLVWLFSILLFFSAADAKLGTYILPLFPAGAALIGLLWRDLLRWPSPVFHRSVLWPYLLLTLAVVVGFVYVLIVPPLQIENGAGIPMGMFNWLIAVLVVFLVGSSVLLVTGRYRGFLAANAGLVAVFVLLFTLILGPAIEHYRSTRQLALKLDPLLPPGAPITFFQRLQDSTMFYTGRTGVFLDTTENVLEHLSSERRAYIVVEKRRLKRIAHIREHFHIVDEVGNKAIISNRKGPLGEP
jgi:4-amino-4-deoxy-L-arabinose transferase-like glycosyltransferase